MIHTVIRGVSSEVGVTLLDLSDSPVLGVLFSDVTVTFRKNGDPSFTTKTVLAGEWREVGDGLYGISFTAVELDRAGSFRYSVSGGTFEQFDSDLIVVDDFEDLATQIREMKADLTAKANIRDVNILMSQFELRKRELEMAIADFRRRLKVAEASVNALRGT